MVAEATLMWSRRAFNVRSEKGLRSSASAMQAYQVTVPAGYNELQVSNVAGIPRRGDRFLDFNNVRCVDRRFTQQSPIYWICEVIFEGEFGPGGASDPAINSPPIIDWYNAQSVEEIDQDYDGNPIVTKNGEPIEGVTMDVSDMILNVQRNYLTFLPHTTNEYLHSVNSDLFAGYQAGQGRMINFRASQQWDEDSGGYWKVNATIRFRVPYNTVNARAWYARTRHEGFYERIAGPAGPDGSPPTIRAVDSHNEPTMRPVLLKEDGFREPNPENAHWLEWKRYKPLPYNALGLL